eukprot:2430060-Rhodomonas_salina.5
MLGDQAVGAGCVAGRAELERAKAEDGGLLIEEVKEVEEGRGAHRHDKLVDVHEAEPDRAKRAVSVRDQRRERMAERRTSASGLPVEDSLLGDTC